MKTRIGRSAFEERVENFGKTLGDSTTTPEVIVSSIAHAAAGAKKRDSKAIEQLCVALARVAFITPEAITPVYDAFTRGWLGLDEKALPMTPAEASAVALLMEKATLPPQFWTSYWGIIRDTSLSMSPAETTSRVAALNSDLPPSFHKRAEAAACAHPGVTRADKREIPAPLTLATLSAQPLGSLGHDFYRFIIDNKFDLEVLDREVIGLKNLPPALHYLNVRILQMHDIWHLVGGYTTKGLHENAISAFQLAQFGHNYSAMYMATVLVTGRIKFPLGLSVLLQVTAEGWLHSRKSPSFMDIEWEKEWHLPIAEIRKKYAVVPFKSIHQADLFERFAEIFQYPILKTVNRLVENFWKKRLA